MTLYRESKWSYPLGMAKRPTDPCGLLRAVACCEQASTWGMQFGPLPQQLVSRAPYTAGRPITACVNPTRASPQVGRAQLTGRDHLHIRRGRKGGARARNSWQRTPQPEPAHRSQRREDQMASRPTRRFNHRSFRCYDNVPSLYPGTDVTVSSSRGLLPCRRPHGPALRVFADLLAVDGGIGVAAAVADVCAGVPGQRVVPLAPLNRSWPALPCRRSWPSSPTSVSSPSKPWITSGPSVPRMVSSPSVLTMVTAYRRQMATTTPAGRGQRRRARLGPPIPSCWPGRRKRQRDRRR
jgi:hypothetical protein